jgi:hypothetical protein
VRQLLSATSRGFSLSMRLARLIIRPTYPRGFRPFATLGDIEGDAFTFIEGHEPGWCESRDVDEYVLSSTIPAMKPKPLSTLNHFTVH